MKREIYTVVLNYWLSHFASKDDSKFDFEIYLDKTEENLEIEIIYLLRKIGISASKKTDKYSLPYQKEIVINLPIIYDGFSISKILRPILKELIEKDIYKIRFYFHIETYVAEATRNGKFPFGAGIKYCFRYFIHK